MHNHLDRNLIGYGPNPPHAQWPGDARIAVSFVLNYEEGGENTILNGDAASEVFLTETPGGTPIEGGRDLSTESMYEYGSRAGFWRILRLFQERNMRFTSWAVGRALELNPAAGKAMAEAGHEVASHGWRWINYKDFTLEQELDHMRKAVKAIEQIRPVKRAGRLVHRPLRDAHARSGHQAWRLSSIRAIPMPTTCPTG
jgi:peptidoglycan/xylan/chitin deacetylase (PgdA/CDA1 family)